MKKVLIVLVIAVVFTGCSSMGVEGRVGFYREDGRQQSSYSSFRPVKCFFQDCAEEQNPQQGQDPRYK